MSLKKNSSAFNESEQSQYHLAFHWKNLSDQLEKISNSLEADTMHVLSHLETISDDLLNAKHLLTLYSDVLDSLHFQLQRMQKAPSEAVDLSQGDKVERVKF